MTGHLGELAALYALGILEPHEARAAEEHLLGCDACRRFVAQAQADVTAMAAAQTQFEPPRTERVSVPLDRGAVFGLRPMVLAVAAAFTIAILPAGYLLEQSFTMHQTMMADARAMARVATSPHRTTAFRGGADAHVMYGPDGSWYVIVIRGASAPLHVMWPHDGTKTMLGTAVPHGDIALLYLPKSHRMDRLTLMLDNREVGQAQLVF